MYAESFSGLFLFDPSDFRTCHTHADSPERRNMPCYVAEQAYVI